MREKTILGLDPGKTTGFAVFDGAEMILSGEIPNGLDGFLEWSGTTPYPLFHPFFDRYDVVCERYVPLEGFRGIDQTHSLEIQGAIRTLCCQRGMSITLQLRSDKVALFGQELTGDRGEAERKEWMASRGLVFDSGHAMDAATHVLVAMKRARDRAFWDRYRFSG